MAITVDTAVLRQAGDLVRHTTTTVAPGPADLYQQEVGLPDAGDEPQLVAAVDDVQVLWRTALVAMAELIDQVGMLARAAADAYDQTEASAGQAFTATGDGVRRAGGRA